MVVALLQGMRTGRVVAFERAVMLLLTLPAGCGGRTDSPITASDAAPPIRGVGPGPGVFDAGTPIPVFEPTPGPADDASVTYVGDATAPVLTVVDPTFVAEAGACHWGGVPGNTTGTGCNWSEVFKGDPVACVGFPAGNYPASALCTAVCGSNANGDVADFCYVNDLSDASAVGGPYALMCRVTSGGCGPTFPPGNGGRRPAYFASLGFGPAPVGREVGTHFARVACMEAGSVEAFRNLRDELRAHGAPKRLVRAAARAMRDEVRHVRMTAALARRFGETPIAPYPAPKRAARSLEEVALENAIEGCVRETYSALECLWQAHRATDPSVRSTMKRIARDEMRHLALSWAVDSWAKSKLGPSARRRLQDAQREELHVLVGEMANDPLGALMAVAGLPRAAQSRSLVGTIATQLAA
jgi:hypothetical protein